MKRALRVAVTCKWGYPLVRLASLRGYSAAAAAAISQNSEEKLIVVTVPELNYGTAGISAGSRMSSRDVNNILWLLDVSLALGEFDRARLFLSKLIDCSYPEKSIKAFNKFLYTVGILSGKHKGDVGYVGEWLHLLDVKYKFPANAATFAIVAKICLDCQDDSLQKWTLERFLRLFLAQGGSYSAIFNEDELLDEDDIRKIVKTLDLNRGNLEEKHHKFLPLEKRVHRLDNIPPVASVKAKGPGLELMRQTISPLINDHLHDSRLQNLNSITNDIPIDGDDRYLREFSRQKALECEAIESALAKWRYDNEQMQKIGVIRDGVSKNILWTWYEALLPSIKDFLDSVRKFGTIEFRREDIKNGFEMDCFVFGKYLTLLKPEKLAAITVTEMVKLGTSLDNSDGIPVTRGILQLAETVESQIAIEQLRKKENTSLCPKLFQSKRLLPKGSFKRALRYARLLADENCTGVGEWRVRWSQDVRLKIGSVLASMFLESAKFEYSHYDEKAGKIVKSLLPPLFHTYYLRHGKKIGIFRWHSDVLALFARQPAPEAVRPKQMPMLVPPLPWTSHFTGAYFYTKSDVLRCKENDSEQKLYISEASRLGHLVTIFKALNVLGDTCWSINRKVFDIILQVWNSGEAFASIPPLTPELVLPPEPVGGTNPAIRTEWLKLCRTLHTQHRNMHSLRCDVNYKIEIARAFIGERMYFPHNLDFRGRAYPIPPHFNHLGNDLSRGLLQFYEGRELGERGLTWLKIHLANVFGYDKASFEEREEFTLSHMEDIYDSADNPLNGSRWWKQAEDPWQCLATCIELTEALRSPDPFKYISHLPVHQDGTCNGLQHYAALGGDPIGACQVNLAPSDRPQDVYSGVAELVNDRVNKDAAAGVEYAKLVQGKITRKLVKRTVMTNVYGVTFTGAREQIQAQVKLAGFTTNAFEIAQYLTGVVFESITTMFEGAERIQNWLCTAASYISKSVPNSVYQSGSVTDEDFLTAVVWTTPLRLPVVQPYRKISKQQVYTAIQTCYIEDSKLSRSVDQRKQKNAFPPNFIHSLDATHMLMSALECKEKGLTYAAVHDSYWTHASDVDTMNIILRKTFIDLHQKEIMKELKTEMEERYKDYKTLLNVSTKSPYFESLKSLLRKIRLAKVKKDTENVSKLQVELDELASKIMSHGLPNNKLHRLDELEGDSTDDQEEITPEVSKTEDQMEKSQSKVARAKCDSIKVWVDLKFPPLPEKGEFDVSRLKDSKYFFS